MNIPEPIFSETAKSWDAYWRNSGDIGAYSMGGAGHPAILAFWDEFFQAVKADYPLPKLIDIGSGNGAVVERAMAVFGNEPADFTCLDISEAAIANIHSRFPGVRGVRADARTIPLESGSFDIITSLFGVEYAGPEALNEAIRLLANGGRLALVLHHKSSSIQQESVASLDAVSRLQESRFISYAAELFKTGFEACRGADRAPYEEAARQLAPAVQELDAIMAEYGEHVAADSLANLYSGVNRMHQNIQRYEPHEVQDWLQRMNEELGAYAQRMSSMCASSIDAETFDRICSVLRGGDFSILRAEALTVPQHDDPLAWVLVVAKGDRKTARVQDMQEYQSPESSAERTRRGEEKLQAWINEQLKAAVGELTRKQVFGGFLVEAKPAWVLPFQILIGKVRERGQSKAFDWFICGEVPTDQINSDAASTPREVARYFALKWQRDAEQRRGRPDGNSADPAASPQVLDQQLVKQAEALYALVEDPRVWPPERED